MKMLPRSSAQLREAGFTVRLTPPEEAEGCTAVELDKPFWYCRWNSKAPMFPIPAKFAEAMLPAESLEDGKCRILISGDYTGDGPFPFHLFDEVRKAELEAAYDRYALHTQAATQAMDDFKALVCA